MPKITRKSRVFPFRVRVKRANDDTAGFDEWERNLAVSLFVGAATFFGQRMLYDKVEAMKGLWLSVILFLAAFVLFPAFEFVWKFVCAPRRILEDENAILMETNQTQAELISQQQEKSLPKLGLRGPYITPSPTEVVRRDAAGNFDTVPGSQSIWVQILPECLTDSPVQECRGRLLRVRKWIDSNKQWESTGFDETLSLGWSLLEQGECPAITQHRGSEKRLNIFTVYEFEGKISPCIPFVPLRARNVFDNKTDIFRFDIQLTAKDCKPMDVCLEAKLGEMWNKPLIAIVNDAAEPPVVFTPSSKIESV